MSTTTDPTTDAAATTDTAATTAGRLELRDVVKILFDVEYQSDSTYQEGYSVAKIQRDDFRSRYLNFFEATKDSNASQVSSKKALCLLLMEFLPSFQTFSMGFLSGL